MIILISVNLEKMKQARLARPARATAAGRR